MKCVWYSEEDFMNGSQSGPPCGAPATHISCVPFNESYTCATHKCRCASLIPIKDTLDSLTEKIKTDPEFVKRLTENYLATKSQSAKMKLAMAMIDRPWGMCIECGKL